MTLGIAAIKDRSGPHQSRRRNHQARRLDEADPLQVIKNLWFELGTSHQFDSGHR